jgi:hypothetical protein
MTACLKIWDRQGGKGPTTVNGIVFFLRGPCVVKAKIRKIWWRVAGDAVPDCSLSDHFWWQRDNIRLSQENL